VLYALLAIVISSPFERELLAVPGGFTLTTVEAAVITAIVVIGLRLGPRQLLSGGLTPLAFVGAVFLTALVAAAIAAPAERGNAFRFVARMGLAAALFVATLRVVKARRHARIVVSTMVIVGAVVALIAVLESARVPAVMVALTTFRPDFHVVAGQLRATGTLLYPTIASMYLEVAFALGLWLLLDQSDVRHARLARGGAFLGLALIGAGIAATLTRAGLFAMAVAIIVVAGLRLARAPRRPSELGTLTALTATLIAIVFVSHTPAVLATRLATEGSQAWYGARYEVPATLNFATAGIHRVPIRVSNTGRLSWSSLDEPSFKMAYHWLRAGSEEVVQFDGARTPFPKVIGPGESATVVADVVAPGEPGSYTLVWDVVHETRAWLSTEGVSPARTQVNVSGAPVARVVTTMRHLPTASVSPARPALWSAAVAMAVDHPWLGVGPDNYRHRYGPYLRLRDWDHRVHANNMYLEVLTGAGLLGWTAFVVLIGAAGVYLWSRVRQACDENHIATVAALAVWITIAGHGLVDSFLGFTSTYVTFAIAAGVALSGGLVGAPYGHANRV
jgi:hypothetical protein